MFVDDLNILKIDESSVCIFFNRPLVTISFFPLKIVVLGVGVLTGEVESS